MPLIRRLFPKGRVRDALERCHAIAKYGYRREYVRLDWPEDGSGRPRILLLADRPGWAYDVRAQALQKHLKHRFDMKVAYSVFRPSLARVRYDLIYVFSFDETYHLRFVDAPRRIIKVVTADGSWLYDPQYGCASDEEMIRRYLADAGTLGAVSKSLVAQLSKHRETLFTPQGVDPELMLNQDRRKGGLKLGWAGNIRNPFKGVKDILIPAAGTEFELRFATGNLTQEGMANFYNELDVICVASRSEGDSRTLLEGMACGCFPVATRVGIVPELVQDGINGLIVERSIDAFRKAFRWCAERLDSVREAGRRNSRTIQQVRSWRAVAPAWEALFDHALAGIGHRVRRSADEGWRYVRN